MSIVNFFFKSYVIQIIFSIYLSIESSPKRYISIPFTIHQPNFKSIINSQTFLDNYFYKNILFDFSLGENSTNSQTVNGIISQESSCFEFIDTKALPYSDNINSFSPRKSSSFNLRKKKIYISYKDNQYMAIGSDFFSFDKNDNYNLSFLFLTTTNESEINFDEIKDKQYIAKLGLVLPNQDSSFREDCPLFFKDSKKVANLSKYKFSFEFNEDNKGNFIFGDEMYNYNPKKFHESQYMGSYSSNIHEIYYNNVYLIDNNNNKLKITDGTYSTLNYSLGVIIGSDKYKKIIDENFFDALSFCKNELMKFNNINYFIYSCEEENFNNKISTFPKIAFTSKKFEYIFELNYNDLFVKINSKYYFLIIFKQPIDKNEQNRWVLGQPFYKKFKFTIDLEQNWVGFYNPDKEIIEKDKIKDAGDNDNNFKAIIIIVCLIIFAIILSIGMFFLGKKLKNDRKKKANELMDDNYDYTTGINA